MIPFSDKILVLVFSKYLILKPLWPYINIIYFICFQIALYSLEEDWTEIVRNAHMLSEKARSQQQALWELVETEVAYIRTLKVIQDVSFTVTET